MLFSCVTTFTLVHGFIHVVQHTFRYYCTMYHFWLLAALSGLVMTTVMSQSVKNFGCPPPLPSKGT